ncbi:hypothetical protein [Actinokineospora enzanensis]|uniref:hypothetical protein n=1 Tax=Actinokineospora enzanensis TaxID=155975 RepID=UPI0012EB5975|nr:hypothetical protein [Actinokineospora enzanensis]
MNANSASPAQQEKEAVDPMPDRRDFLGLLAKITMGASLTAADLAVLASPTTPTPAPSRVGATEARQLADMAEALWGQEKSSGGGTVREAAIAQVRWARQLLGATHTDEVEQDLRITLSDLLRLCGWSSYDLRMSGSAVRYLGQSAIEAEESGDRMRSALALDCVARVYVRAGYLDEALNIVDVGTIPAERAQAHEVTAWLMSTKARTYATAGNKTAAHDALTAAADALTKVTPSRSHWSYTERTLAAETGKVLATLAVRDRAHCPAAIEALTDYTAQTDPGKAKRHAFGMSNLAICHVLGGDVALGVRIGHQTADAADDIHSRLLRDQLTTLAAAARRHPTDGDATDLAHRLIRT